MAAARAAWIAAQSALDPARLVFLDETGTTTNMARLRARAPVGERARAKQPAGHWATTTMIGAVRLSGPCATATSAGACGED